MMEVVPVSQEDIESLEPTCPTPARPSLPAAPLEVLQHQRAHSPSFSGWPSSRPHGRCGAPSGKPSAIDSGRTAVWQQFLRFRPFWEQFLKWPPSWQQFPRRPPSWQHILESSQRPQAKHHRAGPSRLLFLFCIVSSESLIATSRKNTHLLIEK